MGMITIAGQKRQQATNPIGETDYDLKGLSTDIKPTDGIAINSLFLEIDTGKFYFFSGSDWLEMGTGTAPAKNYLEDLKNILTRSGSTFTIPEGITEIGAQACSNWSELSQLTIPDGVTVINYDAFKGCTNLVLAKLPSALETIGISAFESCERLVTLEIPASVSSIGSRVFRRCVGLTVVTFKGTPAAIPNDIFSDCDNITTINVPWAEGAVSGAPWGATNATINYNVT